VREYVDEKKWKEAEAPVQAVAKVIENVSHAIAKAADDLEGQVSPSDRSHPDSTR
jgi:hypothetical protein